MPGETDIAAVAALLADPTRATMLLALSDGRAFTVSELAKRARVAPSTASEHLGRLVRASLLVVEKQGRHSFYRLADPTIVEIIEDLARLAPQVKIRTLSESEQAKALHRARMCYHHLAGTLGVRLIIRCFPSSVLLPILVVNFRKVGYQEQDFPHEAGYGPNTVFLLWRAAFDAARAPRAEPTGTGNRSRRPS